MDIQDVFYLSVFLIYIFIPIFIIANIFNTLENDIKKCRIKYSIISMIATFINVISLIYILVNGKLEIFEGNNYLYIIPGILLFLCIVSYKAGKKQEKIIGLAIASREIESVRFRKGDVGRQDLTVSFMEEDEKL